jgi:colicin import membrane protein
MISLKDEFRKPGMPLSLGLHAAVLVAALVSFASPKPFADAQEAIAVEVIDASTLREVPKGEQQAKPQPTPALRVDRVDDKTEQNPPGEAKRQVNTDQTPKPQEATAKEERKEQTAAVTPPPPAPPVVPPPSRPIEPPKPTVATPPKPTPAEKTDEEEAEEAIRQAQRKKADELRKLEEQRRADEARKREEQRKADEARRQEQQKREQEQARAEAQRQQDQHRREQEEARQRDEQKKLADAKAAEDRRKAEDAKKAQEAARKAAEERRKREADQEARNAATADAARRALLASREAPQNSGNTGAQVSRTPAQGAPTATGQKLNPADRAALAGMIADQILPCWNIPVSGKPATLPLVRIALNQDGSLAATPVLTNSSGDPTFRALADSGMRAIRQCSPFKIPARFQSTYSDWRSLLVQLTPAD